MTIFNADQSCIAIIWTIRSHIYIFMLCEDNTRNGTQCYDFKTIVPTIIFPVCATTDLLLIKNVWKLSLNDPWRLSIDPALVCQLSVSLILDLNNILNGGN